MQELFKKLKELNLQKGKFAIFASGPMGIRGIREIGNLDLIVRNDYFDELQNEGWELKKGRLCNHLEKNGIVIYNEWGPGEWDIEKLITEAEIIDDLPFVKLDEVLKWKKLCNRGDKDLRDIKLIEDYLSKNQ